MPFLLESILTVALAVFIARPTLDYDGVSWTLIVMVLTVIVLTIMCVAVEGFYEVIA